MSKIAVLDDEPDIVELISLNLQNAGHKVKEFLHPNELLDYLSEKQVDLLILDLMLPEMDGLEVCKRIRQTDQDLAIIMLTAKGEELDRVLGLELGADDYMTKPFSPKELVARIKAILRRKEKKQVTGSTKEIGSDILINLEAHEVSKKDVVLTLTSAEFKILALLASRPGWVFSREKILNHLWGEEKAVIDRTIDVHIRHLRKKMGDHAEYIQSVRGVGYKLKK